MEVTAGLAEDILRVQTKPPVEIEDFRVQTKPLVEIEVFQLRTYLGPMNLSIVSLVSIIICSKALMSTLGFISGTTVTTSWLLLFTFCSLHVALRMRLFDHKLLDSRIVILFGVLNGISIGLLNFTVCFNSVGFYQMTKLAIFACTVILKTLFFRKKLSRNIELSLTVLLLGVGVATVTTDLQLNAMGSVLSLLAIITTYVFIQIMTRTIQKSFRVSTTQLLYQSCPYQALTLFVAFLDGFLTNKNVFAFEYTPQVRFFIVLLCLISVSVNFYTIHLIGKTSPLTYQRKPTEVSATMVMASNRVKLLYKGHQILNVIFGILIGLIAVLRWCKGRAEFDRTAIQTFLVNVSMIVLVCVLPQSLIRRYCFEAYIWTGAMVLHDYVVLLMINIQYIRIVMIPGMILILIGTLGWKLRKSRTVEVGSSEKNHDGVNTMKMEDTNNENSSDKLELFGFVSYLLQLSLVTWTQYKGQQGCTPVLSDFLLFFCSALGALGVMLASPLAGVNFRAVSEQVLPVLHKTCAVALFIAVHTLAAEWLGEDMAYVCLPELITVLAWFTICFGESMSVSNFTSHRSIPIMVTSVVVILAVLIPLNANDTNMQINLIMWSFRISLSSSAFSLFHVWLLQDWPGSLSESITLIRLLKVASIVGSSTAAILCAYMMVTDPMIMYEAISSFEHKAIAAVVPIILLILIVLSALYRPGQPEMKAELEEAHEKVHGLKEKAMKEWLPRFKITGYIHRYIRIYLLGRAGDKIFPI